MKTCLQISVFLLFLELAFSSQPKLVIELFRHGARGPLHHGNSSYWQGKEGKLTDVGRAQHLILGASLIQKYPHLKSVIQDPSKLYLQSTNFNRTIESLKFHLWGMYHGGNLSLENLNIYDHNFFHEYKKHEAYEYFRQFDIAGIREFAPTSIKINPLSQEYELLTLEPFACPNTDLLINQIEEDFHVVMKKVTSQLQADMNLLVEPEHVYNIYDVHHAEMFEGRDLVSHSFLASDAWHYLKHGAEYFITFQRWGSELQRKLYGMPLLQKVIQFLEQSYEGTLPYDLVLLSAHDMTVYNLLSALNVTQPQCFASKIRGEMMKNTCSFPNYASQVLIEFWVREGEAKVKFLYEKEVVNLCGTPDEECSLFDLKELFVKNFSSVTLDDILFHCGKAHCALNHQAEENQKFDFSVCDSTKIDW